MKTGLRSLFYRIEKVLAVLVLIPAVLAGCELTEDRDTGIYAAEELSTLTEDPDNAIRLPGMSEGLCPAAAETDFDAEYLSAGFAGLFSEDASETLYLKNAYEKLYPASVTKCMTALLVLENCADLSEKVTVTEDAFAGITENDSVSGLRAGYSYTVEDLLYALVVPSGNDAANALAIHVSGSVDAFVTRMNARAEELGMTGTHFANPNGLHDKNHYTTVYDLYLLAREVFSYPVFVRIAGTENATVYQIDMMGGSESITYTSTNSYTKNYTIPPEGLTYCGGKTGYTAQAGRCLLAMFTDGNGNRYFGVIAKAGTYDALYEEMNRMLLKVPGISE